MSRPMCCRSRGRKNPASRKDFPDLLAKPLDAPYLPYADKFSQAQHKYGPFAPIRAAIEKLKKEKAAR